VKIHLFIVLAAISAPVVANTAIPATEITVFAEGTNGPTEIKVYGSLSNSGVNGGSEGGSESSFASAAPGLTVSANGSTSGGVSVANAAAQGIITIFYEVTGPANIPVPLIISGSASTAASGPDATAEATSSTLTAISIRALPRLLGRAARSPPREASMP